MKFRKKQIIKNSLNERLSLAQKNLLTAQKEYNTLLKEHCKEVENIKNFQQKIDDHKDESNELLEQITIDS